MTDRWWPAGVGQAVPDLVIPADFLAQMADLTSHRIEGIARMGNATFSCPIVSHIEGNLWSGGCPEWGLPAFFQSTLNLYPWVSYKRDSSTDYREEQLYDSGDVPDPAMLHELADWVVAAAAKGPTLVHCQAGLNRSGLIAGLALVKMGRTPAEAISLMREKRCDAVLCNPAFERWLLAQA